MDKCAEDSGLLTVRQLRLWLTEHVTQTIRRYLKKDAKRYAAEVVEVQRGLGRRHALDLHVDVEGLLKPEEAGLSAAERNPVFRTNIFRSEAVIPLGKPTVVGAMDDVASNRRYEIEVTATKVR